MSQDLINWLLGGFGTLLGFVLGAVWQAVKDLQVSDKETAEKHSERMRAIEVLVAGHYMKKEEMYSILSDIKQEVAHNISSVFTKLDRIEDKIDKKADRRESGTLDRG